MSTTEVLGHDARGEVSAVNIHMKVEVVVPDVVATRDALVWRSTRSSTSASDYDVIVIGGGAPASTASVG